MLIPHSKKGHKPFMLFITIMFSVFFAEALVMFILHFLPQYSSFWEAVIDASLLTLLLSPILFFLSLRPLRNLLIRSIRSEEIIRTRSENLANAQRIAQLGSWDWDIKNNTLAWSDEIYRIFGLRPQQFGATYEVFLNSVHPEDRELVEESVSKALNENAPYSIDHRIVLPDSTERIVHEQAVVDFDKDNKPIRMAGTVQDITERKKAEEAIEQYAVDLEESNRLKELFADIISHDLLTPAGVMRNSSELLLEIMKDNGKKKELAELLRDSSSEMVELIKNASKFSKLEATDEIECKIQDLKKIIKDVTRQFDSQLKEKGQILDHLSEESCAVYVNVVIKDVFLNLISNAIKYSPEGSKIEVSINEEKNNQVVSVKDFGEGIADEDKEKIFERFERLHVGAIKGSGLGLAISKRIVDLHHGKIWVEDNPDGGNIFCVSLPKKGTAV